MTTPTIEEMRKWQEDMRDKARMMDDDEIVGPSRRRVDEWAAALASALEQLEAARRALELLVEWAKEANMSIEEEWGSGRELKKTGEWDQEILDALAALPPAPEVTPTPPQSTTPP